MEVGRRFWIKDTGAGKDQSGPRHRCKGEAKRGTYYARAVWISPYQRCVFPEHLASTVPTIQTGLNGPRSQPGTDRQVRSRSVVPLHNVGVGRG